MNTILVVDDEQEIRDQVAKVLEYEGYQPLFAADGQTAIHLARQYVPDVIVSDVMMPGLNGYDVLKTLRNDRLTATIPFIFLTGLSDPQDRRYGMTLGADDFLSKPFETDELLVAIQTRLEKHAREEQRIEALRENISRFLPHELRTPLMGILGTTEFLLAMDRHALPDVNDLFRMIRDIRDSGRRLERLVENYLLYAKLQILAYDAEQRRLLNNVEPVPSSLIASFAIFELTEQAGRQEDVFVELAEVEIPMAEAHLWKIVAELLENAFKFSDQGTPVHVKSWVDDSQWMFSVSDQGRGMTGEQINAVGAYMQFDRQRYEQQGVGLGLTLVSQLVELYGGHVTIHSIPGQGMTVNVNVPLREPFPLKQHIP